VDCVQNLSADKGGDCVDKGFIEDEFFQLLMYYKVYGEIV